MSDDSVVLGEGVEGDGAPSGGEPVPLRVVADAVRSACSSLGVRPPTLRTLRFWRDQGVLDPPTSLGFTTHHAAQALAAAQARSAGVGIEGLRVAAAAVRADSRDGNSYASASGVGGSLAGVNQGGLSDPMLNSVSCGVLGPGLPRPASVWPSFPEYPMYPGTYPSDQWRPVPTTTTVSFSSPPTPALALVCAALDAGDAEGALEHLDAVIRDALRDPSADLVGLRKLRVRLEDLIASHRRALVDLQDTVVALRDAEGPTGSDVGSHDATDQD